MADKVQLSSETGSGGDEGLEESISAVMVIVVDIMLMDCCVEAAGADSEPGRELMRWILGEMVEDAERCAHVNHTSPGRAVSEAWERFEQMPGDGDPESRERVRAAVSSLADELDAEGEPAEFGRLMVSSLGFAKELHSSRAMEQF